MPSTTPGRLTTRDPSPRSFPEPAEDSGRTGRGRLPDWRIRFAMLSLVWGFSFLFIKLGTQAYAPLQVSFGRILFGSLVLLTALAIKREGLPRGMRVWGHLMVSAFFLNALPYSLFAYAELTISSTLAGVINATSPLFSMLLALAALREDRPTPRRLAGLLLGFLGVLTVLGAWRGFTGHDPVGAMLALLAPVSYALGWFYVRRNLAGEPHSHLALSGGQLLLATGQLVVVAPVFTSLPDSFPITATLAIVALGTLGTGLAVLIQYGLVAEVGPTTAQMVTYFIPVIATAAGVILLDEQLGWNTPLGTVVVLLGAALTQSKSRPAGRRDAAQS